MRDYCLLSTVVLIAVTIQISQALECYVCDNQEVNEGKCTSTIQTCQYGEDTCQTEISWGSTPYWQQGALKQFYISKKCATKEKCQKHRRSLMDTCTHIWYQDWKCSECCRGDRCNYYIFSGASDRKIATSMVFATSIAVLISYLYL
ncbi:uncharacterized protein LOC109606075 [Aethina tumida]|uniref:uncharacterized protein LOC109606075 n=1 Tax=Aethina tumida TaxID=116153 RepID=UPI00096B03A9|nr:uncharacterized protein LOC109606075 [Aethina tumida]